MDPYKEIAAFYDLEHDPFEQDLDFYRESAAIVGGPIVEFGSGTGRVALVLAEAGFPVTGVDTSRTMLAIADRRASVLKLGDRYRSVVGNMTDSNDLPLHSFGMVIIGLDSLLHLESQAAQLAVLENSGRLLDPRGQLVIDLLNPSPGLLSAIETTGGLDGSWRNQGGELVQKFSARNVRSATQQIVTEHWYDVTDLSLNVRRHYSRYTLRWLYPSELELLLDRAGFSDWKMYGGYDLEPFEDGAERLIVLAEVTSVDSR